MNFVDGTRIHIDAEGYFFSGQSPATRPLTGLPIEGGCEDWSAGDVFDNGPTAAAMALVATRTYIDKGPTITLKQRNKVWNLPQQLNSVDPVNFLTHPRVYSAPINDEDLTVNAPVDVELPIANGQDPLGNPVAKAQIFMPANFQILSPQIGTELVIPANQDLDLEWQARADGAPPDLTFVAFLDPVAGTTRGACTAPNEGHYLVPSTVVDRFGPDGWILLGTFVHHAYELDGRRMDLMGINCHLIPWRRAN